MVYAKTDNELQKQFSEFQSHELVTKYNNFLKHVQGLWNKHKEWALCYRENLPIRGNNTNISEAGVCILKEIVLSRVKAYNLVELFQFVVQKLESYYQRKLLSVAHNRIDRYIQAKYRGLNAGKIKKEHIIPCFVGNDVFLVKSRHDLETEYQVDTVAELGLQ